MCWRTNCQLPEDLHVQFCMVTHVLSRTRCSGRQLQEALHVQFCTVTHVLLRTRSKISPCSFLNLKKKLWHTSCLCQGRTRCSGEQAGGYPEEDHRGRGEPAGEGRGAGAHAGGERQGAGGAQAERGPAAQTAGGERGQLLSGWLWVVAWLQGFGAVTACSQVTVTSSEELWPESCVAV